jgi:hypothetical protein
MPVEERERHELHARLQQVLGTDEAATLMSYLPPVGWADVATKRDLENFANQLRIEMRDQAVELRVEMNDVRVGLYDKLDANLRVMVFLMIGAILTTAGLAFGAAQL